MNKINKTINLLQDKTCGTCGYNGHNYCYKRNKKTSKIRGNTCLKWELDSSSNVLNLDDLNELLKKITESLGVPDGYLGIKRK